MSNVRHMTVADTVSLGRSTLTGALLRCLLVAMATADSCAGWHAYSRVGCLASPPPGHLVSAHMMHLHVPAHFTLHIDSFSHQNNDMKIVLRHQEWLALFDVSNAQA